MIVIGALTLLLASIKALTATDLKRVLAYSTISQLGYLTYAVGTGAIFASQFHLLSHSIFKALLFLSAGALIHALHTRDLSELTGRGRQFPLIRNAFLIGAAALIGLPLFNGFFSKELLLETGLTHGPLWAYVIALLSVGLTALYITRVVWIVFFAQPFSQDSHSDLTLTLKIPLILLTIGTLTSWLVAGFLSEQMQATLPFHSIRDISISDLVLEIIASPLTYVTLSATAVGLIIWWRRESLSGLITRLQTLNPILDSDFGLAPLNAYLVQTTHRLSAVMRRTQTGQLNWNLVGIVGGLLLVLFVFWIGGMP